MTVEQSEVSLAIVVQCFIKRDTIENLCRSLLLCHERKKFDLIFWSDCALGSQKPEYESLNKTVIEYLDHFSVDNIGEFQQIVTKINDQNLGTCKTCEVALDFAFGSHDFVIFTEDDTIFAPDALQWFLRAASTPEFAQSKAWAIAGESIFFNSQARTVSKSFADSARRAAVCGGWARNYLEFSFVPSTCFATTQANWRKFGPTRGQPLGDVDLNALCVTEGKTCVFPIIPRVKDVGMLHELGYSVAIHSAAGVREVKNTYLTSGEVSGGDRGELFPFPGNADALYSYFTLLDGLDEYTGRAESNTGESSVRTRATPIDG
jgi:hypothetical protein